MRWGGEYFRLIFVYLGYFFSYFLGSLGLGDLYGWVVDMMEEGLVLLIEVLFRGELSFLFSFGLGKVLKVSVCFIRLVLYF